MLKMRLNKILFTIACISACSAAFSNDPAFEIVTKKELSHQLGTFQEIQFDTKQDESIDLYLTTFNKNYRAQLYQQPEETQLFANYMDELSRHHDFTVSVNGSFYQPDFTPVGLFISEGKKIKRIKHSSLLSTCVIINEQQKIILETELSNCSSANNAMQTGPLLIHNGKVNPKLEALQLKFGSLKDFFSPHRRTLLALSDENQLAIITTSSSTLTDIAEFLQNHPEALGMKQVKTAVNLDGGSSTGMYVRFNDEPFYYHELKHVKTLLFIK